MNAIFEPFRGSRRDPKPSGTVGEVRASMKTRPENRRARNVRRLTGWAMGLAVVGLLIAFAGLRSWRDPSEDFLPGIRGEVGMAASRVRQTALRNGIEDWRLDAEGARLSEDGEHAVVDRPEVVLYMEDRREMRLTAREGAVRTATRDIRMSGDVVARDAEYRLETEILRYFHADRRMVTESRVVLSGEKMTLEADRAEFDLAAGRATFRGNVKGTFGDGFQL